MASLEFLKLFNQKEIVIPGTKKRAVFKILNRWTWIQPGKVAIHEGRHGAGGMERTSGMALYNGGNVQGETFYDGAFDPAMAAAPAAHGSDGCSGDHHATVSLGYNWESAKSGGRALLHGRHDLVWLLASALEEDRNLGRGDVQELIRIWKEGHPVEITILDEDGKQEGTVTGIRVGTGTSQTDILRKYAATNHLTPTELPRENVQDNKLRKAA